MEDLTPEERKEVEDAINEVKDEEDDSEKGNVAPIIIAVIVILLIGAGAFVFTKPYYI